MPNKFSVDYYKDGYRSLATSDGTKILVIPEGKEAPKDLEKGIIVMQQPVQNLYLVSSSVMDIFDHLDALDSIRFSSQKEEDWYIEGAKKRWQEGIFHMPENTANRIMNRSYHKNVRLRSRI